ncbi:hypothetical protein Vafri_19027 [Volvox africanus]|uniref:Uncharacterized protein n=1 Tax=Volvox africanus TaxID=51714 RepID=A0A8J4F936_9CHLO|nr:hypothetical protein Vafri_19027 [Volvox africanus]
MNAASISPLEGAAVATAAVTASASGWPDGGYSRPAPPKAAAAMAPVTEPPRFRYVSGISSGSSRSSAAIAPRMSLLPGYIRPPSSKLPLPFPPPAVMFPRSCKAMLQSLTALVSRSRRPTNGDMNSDGSCGGGAATAGPAVLSLQTCCRPAASTLAGGPPALLALPKAG